MALRKAYDDDYDNIFRTIVSHPMENMTPNGLELRMLFGCEVTIWLPKVFSIGDSRRIVDIRSNVMYST